MSLQNFFFKDAIKALKTRQKVRLDYKTGRELDFKKWFLGVAETSTKFMMTNGII